MRAIGLLSGLLMMACVASATDKATTEAEMKGRAVQAVIEDASGLFDESDAEMLLAKAKVITNQEAFLNYVEFNAHEDFSYVEIPLSDCVYDVAVVPLNNSLAQSSRVVFVDLGERKNYALKVSDKAKAFALVKAATEKLYRSRVSDEGEMDTFCTIVNPGPTQIACTTTDVNEEVGWTFGIAATFKVKSTSGEPEVKLQRTEKLEH